MSLFKFFKKNKKPIQLSPSGYPIVFHDEHFKGIQVTTDYYIYNINNNPKYRDILFQNCIVIGSQGSSKSSASIKPNLLNPELADMSKIIFDPSLELYRDTAEAQRKMGVDVYLLSLYHEEERLNLLDFVDDTASAISNFCEKLFTSATKSLEGGRQVGGDSQNWIMMSTPLLASAICILKVYYKKHPNLGTATISEAISLLELSTAEEFFNIVKDCPSAYNIYPFKKESQRTSNVFNNCVTTITTYLNKFKSSNIEYLMGDTTIPIDDLRKKPTALYIHAHPTNPKTDAPIIAPIFQFLFESVTKDYIENGGSKNYKDVYFFLDEFSTIGSIDGIDGFFKNLRKFNVGIFIAVQTTTQLLDVLTETQASAILGNIAHKVFLRNNNHRETSLYLSTIGGTVKVQNEDCKYDADGNLLGYTERITEEQAISLNDAMNIQSGTGYLHVGSLGAIKIDNIKGYWECPRFDEYCKSMDLSKSLKKMNENYNIHNTKKQTSLFLDNYRINIEKNSCKSSENVFEIKNNISEYKPSKVKDFNFKEVALSEVKKHESEVEFKISKFLDENF